MHCTRNCKSLKGSHWPCLLARVPAYMRTHTYIVHTHSYAKQIYIHTRSHTFHLQHVVTSNEQCLRSCSTLHTRTHDTRLLVLFLIPNLHKFYTYFPSCMRYFCAPFHSQIDYLDYHAYFLRISFLINAPSSPQNHNNINSQPRKSRPLYFCGVARSALSF